MTIILNLNPNWNEQSSDVHSSPRHNTNNKVY